MSNKWLKDTGSAITLLFLLLSFKGNKLFLSVAMVFLLLTIVYPSSLYPVAYIWLQVTRALSFIMPKVFFGIVFFTMVVPVGLFKKLLGKDSLLLNKKYQTAFFDRNHKYVKADVDFPY